MSKINKADDDRSVPFQPGPYLWDVVLDTGVVLMRGRAYSAIKYSAGLAMRDDYKIVLSDQRHPNA